MSIEFIKNALLDVYYNEQVKLNLVNGKIILPNNSIKLVEHSWLSPEVAEKIAVESLELLTEILQAKELSKVQVTFNSKVQLRVETADTTEIMVVSFLPVHGRNYYRKGFILNNEGHKVVIETKDTNKDVLNKLNNKSISVEESSIFG